jgi:PAS domain S-box-containing protein
MLIAYLHEHKARIVERLYQSILQTISGDPAFDAEFLRGSVAETADAFLSALEANDSQPLDDCLARFLAGSTVADFPLTVLHRNFTVFAAMLPPLLRECYGDDTGSILGALHRMHLLIDTTLNKLVGEYEKRSKLLVQQQYEQLEVHNRGLETQLIRVGEAYQTLQDFNENILQSMTSGLLVADKDSHRILKVNQAMERLSRRGADEMVGRTVEDVFAGMQGLPIVAFAEEVQRQGSITLRKHRLVDPEGRVGHGTIKGQVFYDSQGREQGVLVLVDDISEREILRDTFSRYLSQPVMEQVLSDKASRSLRTLRREVSVLFADIRGFTTFAERHQPEEVVTALNQYFDRMVRVVFAHHGTLDKYLGDGLMALFGTPLEQPDHPRHAVQAALEMQAAVADLNAARRDADLAPLHIGIGINSGEAIVGNIGTEERMEYTVIGDMVNVAQRLQTEAAGGDIVISDNVLAHIRGHFTVRQTIETRLKGRRQPVRAHRIGPPSAS